jgi:CBS domain-containing protein
MAKDDPNADVMSRVEDLDLRAPVAVGPATPLEAAARIMLANDISALVVGEPGGLVSILTERDVTRALAEGRSQTTEVAALASAEPLTVPPDATVLEVATLMLREGVRHLVVARDGRAVGVVSMRDALGALVRTVTPETVFLMLKRVNVDARGSEFWFR